MNFKKKYKQDILNSLDHKDSYDAIVNKLDLNKSPEGNKNYMKKGLVVATSTLAAALVIGAGTFFLVRGGQDDVNETQTMVKMNLNPSVSFILDDDNKVVSVTGENNEGKMIIAGEAIVGKDLDEAISIVLKIENETGYLVSGNVTADENNLSFSVSVDDEKIKEAIEKSIDTTVTKVCDELGVAIQNGISFAEGVTREALEEIALRCDSTLTNEDVKAMSYSQLLAVVNLYNIETAELFSVELEELYNQAKDYELQFAEASYTKDVISGMGKAYELFMAGYDAVLNGLHSSIDALNDLQYQCFVSEASLYQKTTASFMSAKQEVIAYKNALAQVDAQNEELKASIQKSLDAAVKILDGIQGTLDGAADAANASIDGAISLVQKAIDSLEAYKKTLPKQDEIEAKLQEQAKELETTLNTKKDELFKEFETKYSTDIEKAKQEVLDYKQSLKDKIANKE